MSEFYQPGQHPDADQLSAFAEDALPAHEREQTLVHLASCVDCRTIVSLALPPIEDVPEVQPVALHRPWFYGWNVAWLAGAGLAALIFLTVHMHNNRRDAKIAAGTPTQTAEVRPTAPVPPAAMEPAAIKQTATISAPAPAAKAVPPPPPPAAADSGQALQSPAAGMTINGQQIANVPLDGRRFLAQTQQQQPSQQQQAQQQNGAAHGYAFGAGTGGSTRNNLSPYAQNNATTYNSQNSTGATAAMPAPAAPPPVLSAQAPSAPAGAAKAVTGNATTVSADELRMATTDTAAPMMLTAGVAGVQKLPSHLAVASTITHADQMLALDTAGTLFLSTNGGHHWKAVAAPWPGRAVSVTLAALPLPAEQPPSPLLDSNASGAALSNFAFKSSLGPSISGVITDPTGAIIPGVSLRITNTRTGIVRSATTDRSGHYDVAGLTPDTYRIDASAPGFEAQRTFVTLTAAQQSVVNISLRVGASNETIEVNAESSLKDDKMETKALRAKKNASLSEAPATFEITTDSGEIWTSADGKSWKRK